MGRLAEERLWWHVASHFHPETLQWSPPHSRTYAADAVGGPSGLKWIVYKETGIAGLVDPDLRGALESQNLVADVSRWTDATIWKGPAKKPSSLANPANAARAVMCRFRLPEHVAGRFYTPSEHSMTVERTQPHQDILSYRTRRYTVGCVNHGFQNPHKGNLFVWYTAKPGYVLPHRLLYTEFCRRQNTRSTPLGYSAACGDRGRYIILYSVFSGKEEIEFPEISVDLVVPDRSQPDELWCGGGPVAELPADLPVNGPLFIREGGVYFAIRPIPLADLGRPSPFTASDDRGDLQVSIWAYRGEARSFGDELRGRALAGYLLEVGDEEEYGSFDAFRETVRAGRLDVAVEGRRVQVRHAAGSDSMSLEWDPSILANETYRTEVPVSLPLAAVRRVRGRLIEPPVLDDPWGQIRAGGPIVVGGAALAPTPEPVGLWATPEGDACSLWQPHPSGMPVHLSTAVAEVRCPSFPMGILVLKREDGGVALEIEAAERVGLLRARPIGVAGLRATVAGVSAKAVAATGVPGQEGWLEIRQVGDES